MKTTFSGEKIKKKLPFDFMLELLAPGEPYWKHMFGAVGVYLEEKIVFVLFDKRNKHPVDSGIWIVTSAEHHASLREEFPSLRSITLFGSQKETAWQVLPAESERFEEDAHALARHALKGDPRIGKVPKPKKRKAPEAAPGSTKRKRR